ncbi:Asp-tRNA(Asn)/Glu-tRNA(Gln) amidotransferase subunit GatC [Candidatus Dependentiae bacterium]|nr:Asp-tRNA(Asn)/Glu-tRNA(Gln) amidotransferase subunit GatC [Candidatus Dependentiae bacterium]
MIDFSKEELLKLAQLSSLKLYDDEIEYLREQLQKTLDYTEELAQFETKLEHEAVKTINVFREDKAIQKDSAPLLAQAPATKETYFVVPKILD